MHDTVAVHTPGERCDVPPESAGLSAVARSAEAGVTVLAALLAALAVLVIGVGFVVGLRRIGPTAFRLHTPPPLTAERTATLQEALSAVVAGARIEKRGDRLAVVLPARRFIRLHELAAPEGDYRLDADLLAPAGESLRERLVLVDTSVGVRSVSAELPAFVLGALGSGVRLRLSLKLPSGVWTAERAVPLPIPVPF